MEQQQVKEHFCKQAADNLGLMKRLIPKFAEQNEFLCELIPFDRDQPSRVLDLGAGPGVLSELVLKLCPQAKVLAFDITVEMLEPCRQRMAEFEGRFELKQGDFKTDSFGAGYDLIVAGLALHHLEDKARQVVFSRLYRALNESGIFLAREIVVDTDTFVTDWHYPLWRSFMRANGEDDAFWYDKHQQKDHPVPVENQSAPSPSPAAKKQRVCE